MSVRIGIMQGRLLPPIKNRIQAFPRDRWPEEFPLAHTLGFDNIEFIFDAGDGEDIERHPLLEKDCRTIQALVEQYGVAVTTVCADYFMKHPLHRSDLRDVERNLDLLSRLIKNGTSVNISDIVVPCVDESSLVTDEDQRKLVERLRFLLPECEKAGVNLAIEADLKPREFRRLLDSFDSPRVTVNYDVGNSASLGYEPLVEWDLYGERISSVHIKDRLFGGPTVPLGTGSARFEDFFRIARERDYQGLFVIQGARGTDDVAVAYQYKRFVAYYIDRFFGKS